MILSYQGKTPKVHPTAWVSKQAYVEGDVEIGENVSILPFAVLRGDIGSIRIGANSNVQDTAVLHSHDLTIEHNVQIAHGVIVHGKRIGNHTQIGINATILFNVEIGNYCLVGANALIPDNMKIPDGSLVMGVPAVIKGPISPAQRRYLESMGDGYVELGRKHKAEGL